MKKFLIRIIGSFIFVNFTPKINFNLKIITFLAIIQLLIIFNIYTKQNISKINDNYLKIKNDFNILLPYKINRKINIGIYCFSIKNGGIERLTSLLINYLSKIKIFKLYLFTKIKENNEYAIPEDISRIIIKYDIYDLIKKALINKIDILIYNFYHYEEINILNNIKEFKTIFYNHSCFLFWIYANLYNLMSTLYTAYKDSNYVISLIPFENDYLFKKWGINSILMNNFITYEYNEVVPSNLTSKNILMIGRASDKYKRFELGIKAMKYIVKEIPQSKMIIISDLSNIDNMKNIIHNLTLENYIEFVGYTNSPEIYYKNASLHIFPTISESFGLVMCETKIYGIPNILVGVDYLSGIKGGTIIVYDDKPQSIAKEAIKILKNDKYRIKLGKEARKSMKKFNNNYTLNKWIKLIFSIYNGKKDYEILRKQSKKIDENSAKKIIKNQINLLKLRIESFKNLKIREIENFTLFLKYKTFVESNI